MDETKQEGKKGGTPGWVWLSLVIIVVAGILFITQKQATAPSDETKQEQPTPGAVDVPLTVTLTGAPKSIVAGTIFGVDWNVASEATILTSTAIWWDTTSHPGDFGTEVDGTTAGYAHSTEAYKKGSFAVPADFEDNIKAGDDLVGQIIYLRAHAVVLGKNYWSAEVAVPVKAYPTEGTETK